MLDNIHENTIRLCTCTWNMIGACTPTSLIGSNSLANKVGDISNQPRPNGGQLKALPIKVYHKSMSGSMYVEIHMY